MTTERIPIGYTLLDALLGGGLRAGTLTAVLYEDNEACRDAANKLHGSIGARTSLMNWHGTQGNPDPIAVKHDAQERGRIAVISGVIGRDRHPELRHTADVILTICGTEDHTVIEAIKNRWGKTDAVVFRWHAGIFRDVEAIDLGQREPAPARPDPAAVEHARWVEAMRDLAADLDRRDQACQQQKDAARLDRDAEALHAKATTYAHAAEMLRVELARMTGD